MGERRAAPEMHKRDEMVGKDGGRDAESWRHCLKQQISDITLLYAPGKFNDMAMLF